MNIENKAESAENTSPQSEVGIADESIDNHSAIIKRSDNTIYDDMIFPS